MCRRHGIYRDTYYQYRRRYLTEGSEGLGGPALNGMVTHPIWNDLLRGFEEGAAFSGATGSARIITSKGRPQRRAPTRPSGYPPWPTRW